MRKRSAESDEEMDRGRTKKVKKYREERSLDYNPFQVKIGQEAACVSLTLPSRKMHYLRRKKKLYSPLKLTYILRYIGKVGYKYTRCPKFGTPCKIFGHLPNLRTLVVFFARTNIFAII